MNSTSSPARRSPRPPLMAVAVGVVAFTLLARQLGYRLGGNVVVRCRRGHLFTTLWIPGIKLTGLDLVIARWQRCPVERHWSLVTPVRDTDLTDQQRQVAARHHIRIP